MNSIVKKALYFLEQLGQLGKKTMDEANCALKREGRLPWCHVDLALKLERESWLSCLKRERESESIMLEEREEAFNSRNA